MSNFVYKSDDSDKIVPVLVKIQGVMPAPKRTATNAVSMSKYAPLDEVLTVAKPLLKENGLACINYRMLMSVPAASGDGEVVREVLVTQLLHESGQFVQTFTILRPSHPAPQAMASVETLARRYNLKCLLNIAEEDDDDDGNASQPHQAGQSAPAADHEDGLLDANVGDRSKSQVFLAFERTFNKLADRGDWDLLRAFIKERMKDPNEIAQATKMVEARAPKVVSAT